MTRKGNTPSSQLSLSMNNNCHYILELKFKKQCLIITNNILTICHNINNNIFNTYSSISGSRPSANIFGLKAAAGTPCQKKSLSKQF